MTCPQNMNCIPVRAAKRPYDRLSPGVLRGIILSCLILALLAIPASAGNGMNSSAPSPAITPAVVHIGVYVVDLKEFSVEEGTYTTNFYLNLVSDSNVSIDDFEIMNGHITSIDTIADTPKKKITGSLQ